MSLETKRKLIKFSNYSFCLTLPKTAIDQLGWGKGDEVQVVFDDAKQIITISKPSQKPSAPTPPAPGPTSRVENQSPKLRW